MFVTSKEVCKFLSVGVGGSLGSGSSNDKSSAADKLVRGTRFTDHFARGWSLCE